MIFQIIPLFQRNKGINQGNNINKIIGIINNGSIYSSSNNSYEVYDDIFYALSNGKMNEYKSPASYDSSQYADKLYAGKNIISFGAKSQSLQKTAMTKVPTKYSVLWLHLLNDRRTSVTAYYEKTMD